MEIKETYETWESLQKGQIAELAFERIALAHEYAVKYNGRQYQELLIPSDYRKKTKHKTNEWLADFELHALHKQSKGWELHAVVEVKWRQSSEKAPSEVPPKTNYLILFTPDGIFAAEATDGKLTESLIPLEDVTFLGFEKAKYEEIMIATQALISAFDGLKENMVK